MAQISLQCICAQRWTKPHSFHLIVVLDYRDEVIKLSWDKDEIISQIQSVSYLGGNTNTADALKSMRRDVFSRSRDRSGAQNVAVLLADGMSNINQVIRQKEGSVRSP